MKIIQSSPDMEVDRMYCPSTDEVIFAPYYEEINDNAEAFIAYWHCEVMDQPEIKDKKLKDAWDKYFGKWSESDEIDIFEAVEEFLKSWENPDWKVFECTFEGMACGPVTTTIYYVVKTDTVIELDPEPGEDPFDGMTEKEIEDEVLRRQIRSIMKGK